MAQRSLDERVRDITNPLIPLGANMLSEWLNAAHLIVDLWDEVSRLRTSLDSLTKPASETEASWNTGPVPDIVLRD